MKNKSIYHCRVCGTSLKSMIDINHYCNVIKPKKSRGRRIKIKRLRHRR